MIYLLLQLVLVSPAFAAYCGTSTIPFSFEVLPNGEFSLGCARPTCFGWDALGQWATQDHAFLNQGSHQDGYLRAAVTQRPPFDYANPEVRPQMTMCAISNTCAANQWAGGYFKAQMGMPATQWCCGYGPLSEATSIGRATVGEGQIVIGGEQETDGAVTYFDYIRNIEAIMDENGQVTGYHVNMGRMPCRDPPALVSPRPTFYGPQSPPAVEAPAPAPQAVAPASQQYYYYPSSYCSSGCNWLCFSEDMKVRLADGSEKRMDQLEINDELLVPARDMRGLIKSSVRSWLHKMPSEKAEFVVIQTIYGYHIKLTAGHYIYKTDCAKPDVYETVTADTVKEGDCIFSSNETGDLKMVRVKGISKTWKKGIYAPLTATGRIMVNGIAASCHSEFGENIIVQTLHKSFVHCDSDDLTCSLKENALSVAFDMAQLVLPISL